MSQNGLVLSHSGVPSPRTIARMASEEALEMLQKRTEEMEGILEEEEEEKEEEGEWNDNTTRKGKLKKGAPTTSVNKKKGKPKKKKKEHLGTKMEEKAGAREEDQGKPVEEGEGGEQKLAEHDEGWAEGQQEISIDVEDQPKTKT